MYAIGNVIYGTPLNEQVARLGADVRTAGEDDPLFEHLSTNDGWGGNGIFEGFQTRYHGAVDTVGFFGVELGTFDECGDFPLSDLTKLTPTDQQKAQVEAEFAKLPEEVRTLCRPLNVYVVWSTS